MKTIAITEQDYVLALKLNALRNPSYPINQLVIKWRWFLLGIVISALFISIYLHQYSTYEFTGFVILLIGCGFLGAGLGVFFSLFLIAFRGNEPGGRINYYSNRIH